MAMRKHSACLAQLPETEPTTAFSEDEADEPLLLEEEFDPTGVAAAQEDPSFTPTEDGYGDWAPRRSQCKSFEAGKDLNSWTTDDGFEDQPFARVGLVAQLAAATATGRAPLPPASVQPPPQPCAVPPLPVGNFMQRWVCVPCVVTVCGAGAPSPQPIAPAPADVPAPMNAHLAATTQSTPSQGAPVAACGSEAGEVLSQSTSPPTSARTGGSSGTSSTNETSDDEEPRTTVMLRNIPNDYTRQLLLDLMDEEGFASAYDFVYLPLDFKRKAGLGYAFVNLVDVQTAERFFAHFEGFHKWRFDSKKVCQSVWGEPLRSLAQHIERHRDSPLMHKDVPDEFKPVIFQNGVRVDFPQPSKRVRPPRVKF